VRGGRFRERETCAEASKTTWPSSRVSTTRQFTISLFVTSKRYSSAFGSSCQTPMEWMTSPAEAASSKTHFGESTCGAPVLASPRRT